MGYPDYMDVHLKEVVRSKVMTEGQKKGETRATEDYPYATLRDLQAVTSLANTIGQQWAEGLTLTPSDLVYAGAKEWMAALPDMKRLFTTAFIRGYMDVVKRKDEEEAAKRQPAPQPKPQPQPQQQHQPSHATPSNVAKLHGATITLKWVDHSNPDECVYLLEVRDPKYMDSPYEQEWVIPIVDDITGTTSSDYTSGGTTARAEAGGDFYSNKDYLSQKPKRPGSGYFREPQ